MPQRHDFFNEFLTQDTSVVPRLPRVLREREELISRLPLELVEAALEGMKLRDRLARATS